MALQPVLAEDDFREPRTVTMSYIRTDREPRPWKYLKLVPGKIKNRYYSVLLADGTTITREADHVIEGIRDDRPLSDSHPNLYWVFMGMQFMPPIVIF